MNVLEFFKACNVRFHEGESIHQARFKQEPENFKAIGPAELDQLNKAPRSSSLFSVQ